MTGAGLRSWLEDRRSNSRREGGVFAVIVAFLVSCCCRSRRSPSMSAAGTSKGIANNALPTRPPWPGSLTSQETRPRRLRQLSEVRRRPTVRRCRPDIVVSVTARQTPTRLRVSITHKINNSFGGLIGFHHATISRTAVADCAEPGAAGQSVQRVRERPRQPEHQRREEHQLHRRRPVLGQRRKPRGSQGKRRRVPEQTCSGEDGCSGTTNADYDANGYFYTVNVEQATTNLGSTCSTRR